ncbi:MAG: SH3 domain-containing protein [Chloroflexi bacterium]|nr:SH3 domain-containing protein [Chloroflexota bacterium]
MTNQNPPYPPDEPIIGAASFPPPPPGRPVAPPYIGAPDDGYDDDVAEEDEWDDEYGYDDDAYYYDEAPARQPTFYMFIGLAVLLGVGFVALLFSLVNNNGDDSTPKVNAAFNVAISQPLNNEVVPTGKQLDIIASASSNETITRFELFIDDQPVTQGQPGPADGTVYRATLKWQFDRSGTHKMFVRVTSVSGATADSTKVNLRVIEPIDDKPAVIKGKAITTTNVRLGPGEQFESIGRLNDGQEVKILARSRNTDWLYIEFQTGGWVKRAAIEAEESLEFLSIKDVTPTPAPSTKTPNPSATPSVSPSATANANAPDFVPTGAVLIDGGTTLRVTIANTSTNNYNGPLVVSVGGLVGTDVLKQVFSVNLVANGSATVDFDLNPPVTVQKTAAIKVDPDNAIKEANEDNNNASIGLSPPVEAPNIVIDPPAISGGTVTVVIKNTGGAMPASSVKVRIKIGGGGPSAESATAQIALASGQSSPPFTVAKPGSGAATVEVLVNDQVVASTTINLPP